MAIAQEEIFGPVICLIPYKDIDEAIEKSDACFVKTSLRNSKDNFRCSVTSITDPRICRRRDCKNNQKTRANMVSDTRTV